MVFAQYGRTYKSWSFYLYCALAIGLDRFVGKIIV